MQGQKQFGQFWWRTQFNSASSLLIWQIDWIYSNISGQLKGNNTVTNWQLTFSQATWALWLWRNKLLFDQHFTLTHDLGAQIRVRVK